MRKRQAIEDCKTNFCDIPKSAIDCSVPLIDQRLQKSCKPKALLLRWSQLAYADRWIWGHQRLPQIKDTVIKSALALGVCEPISFGKFKLRQHHRKIKQKIKQKHQTKVKSTRVDSKNYKLREIGRHLGQDALKLQRLFYHKIRRQSERFVANVISMGRGESRWIVSGRVISKGRQNFCCCSPQKKSNTGEL